MAYNLSVAECADELLDNILHYLIYQLNSRQAAKREAVTGQLDYVIVFNVKMNIMNIVGIFYQLENYQKKL